MILSNTELIAAMTAGDIVIEPALHHEADKPPYNTTTVDLRLAPTITVPRALPVSQRIDGPYDANFVARNSDNYVASAEQPFCLDPDRFILAHTIEWISLPIRPGRPVYAARVEGKSSRARLGMLSHFSAPTVHAGFEGTITLEIINLGPNSIQLIPGIYICQIVFEIVAGIPHLGPSQFRGQRTAAGDAAA
jgi:dCTP deaminase